MPECYTCHEEIIFDKNIRSKTGKPIPLWPDGQNTHGHDEQGQPIRGELPSDYTPKPKAVASTFQPKPFQAGAWRNNTQQLDKNNTVTQTDNAVLIQRNIVQTNTLTKEFQQFKPECFSAFNEIIKRLDKLEEAVAHILPTTLETAKEKYDREQEEINKWDKKIPDDPEFNPNNEDVGEGADTE